LRSLSGEATEEDINCLVGFLEVAIAFVDFGFALLIVRVSWLRSLLECPLKLVALFGGVVAILMPQTLLFEQVLETTEGLFCGILCRALNSRNSVVLLTLVVRTKVVVVVVVVVATPLILDVVAARVVLAPAAIGVVLSIDLVFLIGP
jgi:hypothetical protein